MNNLEDEVYYKIYYYEPEDYVTIVCMQWFDEKDYTQENFYTDQYGDAYLFRSIKDAQWWLNKHIQNDKIDPKYKYINSYIDSNLHVNKNLYMK